VSVNGFLTGPCRKHLTLDSDKITDVNELFEQSKPIVQPVPLQGKLNLARAVEKVTKGKLAKVTKGDNPSCNPNPRDSVLQLRALP
jgi:hypothetical protein